ncbi:hypothetical protein HJC23_007424 [Cyclotella cryptica]|uniref:Uncharacterized protein n=1 Tax=Cyclotella cryptica TaxID=29204 RepID=A0ABD3QJC3_9STRA|eukprot:CCRYP_005178-RA/>CCRYP_005178-RA protein AED:0.03 eAED:0.03 QI:327/1/1/1/0.5/0.33/3/1611/453
MKHQSLANAKSKRSKKYCRMPSLLLCILFFFMLFIACFQVYIFHSHTTLNYGNDPDVPTQKDDRENNAQLQSSNQRQSPTQSKKTQPTDVIVYLAQFGKYHTSYGFQQNSNKESITGLSKLNKSLELLYRNYVDSFPSCDILIFFDSDHAPDNETMVELRRDRPQLQFRELKGKWWELPHGLKPIDRFQWNRPAFSIGYRHMIRWFAILIWKYLWDEGYSHVMRIDDDSYLHSKIKYNIFDFMRRNNKRYGFRMPVLEEAVGVGYDVIIDEFLNVNPNTTSQDLIDTFRKERYVGFYNNWFIADISFFLTPPASLLLDLIDQIDIIYTQRTGDLVIHSTVVRLFLNPNQIQWFRDFTYEHMTLCRKEKCGAWVTNGCPQNGGISRGIGAHTDEEWMEFSRKVTDRFKDKTCIASLTAGIDFIGAEDIRYCSKIYSRCRFYMEMLINQTANTTN